MTTEQYSMGYEAGHTDGWNEAVDQPPAPDCRTCRFSHIGALSKCCDVDCTNGDQYQPAPQVVLWKTS